MSACPTMSTRDQQVSARRATVSAQKQKDDLNLSSGDLMPQYVIADTEMSALNNDCLRHIFQHLPITDRVRIERVCKHWQMLSLDSWRDFKVLTFENKLWGFKNSVSVTKINQYILRKILKRGGRFLIEINLSDNNKHLGQNILKLIAKYCPNLQYLNTVEVEVTPWSLRDLSKNCNKLRELILGDCTDECDDELSLLFEKNKRLKKLIISSNYGVNGKCLEKLNSDTIECLVFENCPVISLNNLSVVKYFRKLTVLVLEHFHDSSLDFMKSIRYCRKSLKTLTLSMCPFYSGSLQMVAELTNLRTLDLASNLSVNDELLISIGANCKLLKRVIVSCCYEVTDRGLASIVSLPNLEYLYIEELCNVTDQVFNRSSMPKLREMDCSYCTNMKDAGLTKLIESSENIEELILTNCKNVSNNFLEAAIKATKMRKNNLVLRLYLGNTSIRSNEVSDTSPLLHIIPLITINE